MAYFVIGRTNDRIFIDAFPVLRGLRRRPPSTDIRVYSVPGSATGVDVIVGGVAKACSKTSGHWKMNDGGHYGADDVDGVTVHFGSGDSVPIPRSELRVWMDDGDIHVIVPEIKSYTVKHYYYTSDSGSSRYDGSDEDLYHAYVGQVIDLDSVPRDYTHSGKAYGFNYSDPADDPTVAGGCGSLTIKLYYLRCFYKIDTSAVNGTITPDESHIPAGAGQDHNLWPGYRVQA